MTIAKNLYVLKFSNGKEYFGISQNPIKRFAAHRQAAARGSHYAVHAAIRKHGLPKMQVLCIGARGYIADLEVKAIATFHTRDHRFGYNQAPGGDMNPLEGIGHSAASLAKMSVSQSARAAREGGRVEHMTKIAQLAAAIRSSADYRAVASTAATLRWKEYPITDEQRQRAREKSLGNTNCIGRKLSDETRTKISGALKGKNASAETRLKMSQARTAYWAQRRS